MRYKKPVFQIQNLSRNKIAALNCGVINTWENTMQNLKILIVEDEQLIANDILGLLTDWGYEVVGCANHAAEAIAYFEKYSPDMVLLDIHLGETTDGVDLARHFNSIRKVPLVFLTAQADFQTVERAKTVEPAAYLLKPFDERHLHISLELAMSNFSHGETPQYKSTKDPVFAHEVKLGADVILKQGNAIFIKQNYKFTKFKIEDLVYIEADHNHTYLVMKQQKYIVRMPLALVIERLADERLVRVHRSYAINRQYVEEFDDTQITVNHKTIPLTSAYREDFLKTFNVL
jgi:two-component system, response regulator PdtaR